MNHRPHAGAHTSHALFIISRAKGHGLSHLGLQLPNGRVAHCAPGRGEHLSSIAEFAMGQDVTTVETIHRSLHAATLKRIAASMRSPRAYHATNNNCEIFVNRMLGRAAVSPQLNAALLIAGLALIGFAATA